MQEQVGVPAREGRSSDKLGLCRNSRNRAVQRQGHGRYSLQSHNHNARWPHPTQTSPTVSSRFPDGQTPEWLDGLYRLKDLVERSFLLLSNSIQAN